MKPLFAILLSLSFFTCLCQPSIETSIVDLEMPNSPAFILLDAAPASIQRPNSSRAIGISLLQDLATDGILDDIAVEVTPFWLTRNTKRSALRFYGIDENLKQNPFSKIKLASISAAYIKGPDSILNISVGFRATVFEWKRKSDVKDYSIVYSEIEKMLSMAMDFNEEFQNKNPQPESDEFETNEDYEKALADFRQARAAYIDHRLKETAIEEGFSGRIQEIIKRNPPWPLMLPWPTINGFLIIRSIKTNLEGSGFGAPLQVHFF